MWLISVVVNLKYRSRDWKAHLYSLRKHITDFTNIIWNHYFYRERWEPLQLSLRGEGNFSLNLHNTFTIASSNLSSKNIISIKSLEIYSLRNIFIRRYSFQSYWLLLSRKIPLKRLNNCCSLKSATIFSE